MVCVIGGKWLYSCCFVGCYFQDLFKIAYSIVVPIKIFFPVILSTSGASIWPNLEKVLFYFIKEISFRYGQLPVTSRQWFTYDYVNKNSGQNEPGSNGNGVVLYTQQSSETRASPLVIPRTLYKFAGWAPYQISAFINNIVFIEA